MVSDERDDEGFDQAEAAALEREDDEDVECGDEHAGEKRQAEEKLQGDGRAQDFGQVAGGDGNFTDDPQEDAGASGIVIAAGLGQVAPGSDAELCGEGLQEHRHQVADEDDAE